MKRATVMFFLLVSAVTARAQSYAVVSDLPNNGASVLRDYVNPYADVAMFPVIAVGKFSNATQTVDDIATIDATGNLSCLTNNGDGTFSQPIVTSAIPLSALPITASRVITLPNSTSTLLLAGGAGLNGNAGTSTLFILTFTGCVPTTGGPGFTQGPLLYISDEATVGSNSFVLLTFVCDETALSFGSSSYNFSGTYCATQFWPGPFVFPSITYQDATVIVGKFGAAAPATIAFTDAGTTNQISVEGEYFLGFIQTPDGIVTASSTNNQLFLDQINADRTITAIGAYTLAGNPVGMVDPEEGDLVVAAGNQVTLFTYAGTTGRPLWNVANTLTASGQIGAIDTGSLVANESDIVVQIGSKAEVFSSRSFTEVQSPPPPPPPTPPTYTLTVLTNGNGTVAQTPVGASFATGTVITLTETPGSGSAFSAWSGGCSGSQSVCTVTLTSNTSVLATFAATPTPSLAVAPPSATVSAGNSASYAVTPQNFSTAPTLTATCSIPKGACSISGGQLVATTTATTTSAVPFDFYRLPWAPMLLAVLVLVSLYLVPSGKRRTAAVGFAVACCLALTACSSGSRPPAPQTPTPVTVPGTPAGSYTITITATQGTTVVNSSAVLQVQ